MSAERPAPRLAATVLLVRDADSGPGDDVPRGGGLEVFMVRAQPVVTVRPELATGAGGKRELRIPPEAGYPPLPPGLAKYGSV